MIFSPALCRATRAESLWRKGVKVKLSPHPRDSPCGEPFGSGDEAQFAQERIRAVEFLGPRADLGVMTNFA
ncbi:MAG: hypothetical protein ABR601_10805, partial [Parasphingopyxis sp.]